MNFWDIAPAHFISNLVYTCSKSAKPSDIKTKMIDLDNFLLRYMPMKCDDWL